MNRVRNISFTPNARRTGIVSFFIHKYSRFATKGADFPLFLVCFFKKVDASVEEVNFLLHFTVLPVEIQKADNHDGEVGEKGDEDSVQSAEDVPIVYFRIENDPRQRSDVDRREAGEK